MSKPVHHSRIVIFLNGLIVAFSFTFGKPDLLLAIMITIILTGLYFLIATKSKDRLNSFVRDIGIHFLTVFYLYIPLYFIFKLKELGANYLFFLILVLAIGDSAAYFIGSLMGKHKIYPVASPNKSLEGLIAAIVFAALSGWLALLIFPLAVPVKIWVAMLTGGLIGLFSQLSDPIESLFKRAAGEKDSASILPGHGGFFDRIDSYIFCAPALFYLVKYLWYL
jgi:phosphatidate cytidylyltransferase